MVSTSSSTACNEIVRSAIRSTEPVRDSEEIAPSTPTAMASTSSSTACIEIVPSAIRSTEPVPDSAEIAISTPTAIASTSSSTANASTGKIDVFINHHGEDVKKTLASAIYHRLKSIGVPAFLDKYVLKAGEEFPKEINEAIRSASLHIAIFSPNYARSWWCLHELTLMLQTGNTIIPIFYRVEPSDLRHIKGEYSTAFSEHEEKKDRYMPQALENWKEALLTASNRHGYKVKEGENDDEGLLLEQIVVRVEEEMKKMTLLHVATHPVGLDEALKEFQNLVESGSQCPVKIVGIAGLGGSGKTTLAREYFNEKRSSYDKSSFISGVRAAENRLHDLQEQLLEDLVNVKQKIYDRSAGKGTLERRVPPMRVLIVLDDVDNINQIEDLLPLKGNLQRGSLVIVTSRDSSVIKSSASLSPSVSMSVHIKKGLDPVHAKQLFCRHAFLRDSPKEGFEGLVEKFLGVCKGLPLILKVKGAHLNGNNSTQSWESEFHKISKILPEDIKQILKPSYDALDEEQKQMFLDVACFFIGEQKDMAISIWDGSSSDDGSSSGGVLWSGWQGFQILENKCLVEVDHKNCIRMHDHLRDLGREIAIKKTPSRFWSHSQFVSRHRPLEERLPIRGIMAATDSSNDHDNERPFGECMQLLTGHSTSRSGNRKSRKLTPSALGLQLLVVRGDHFEKQFAKLSKELVWLRWYDFPHEKLPSWLLTEKLRVLELYEAKRLTELWGPNDAPPSDLRELIVTDIRNLQMIPETVGFLEHLKKIVLTGFNSDISSLPDGFCLLKSLEHLELPNFSSLASLPIDFGNLTKLKYIDLRNCKALTALPESFTQLTELQYLHLSRTGLSELPADIDRLAKLEELEIGGPCLTSLPTSLGKLPSLIKLNIVDCGELTHLPGVGCLTRLEKLTLDRSGVKYLPEGFGQLVNLQNLWIFDYPIENLPFANPQESNLPRLKSIILRGTKVSAISISGHCCPRLEELTIHGNDDLMEIETLPTTLKRVTIYKCQKLENIRLDNLSSVLGLVQLKSLHITECPELHELPSFACCTCLNKLWILGNNRVTKMEGLENLELLETLRLVTSWKEPGIERLKNQDKMTLLQITAESRSAIERCIPPNIMKRACRMEIVGRAVEEVELVVGSLSFPNLIVVNTPHEGNWQMELPLSNISCMIACFVLSCSSHGIGFGCKVAPLDTDAPDPDGIPGISLLEEKQVYIGVWPKGFPAITEGREGVLLSLIKDKPVQIEKGMAVIMRKSEAEAAALETLYKFLGLLAR